MKENVQFIRSDNYLTKYSHTCGYHDSATVNDDAEAITLGFEGGVYHVRARTYNGHGYVWKCFDDRKSAVTKFRTLIRERHAKRNKNRKLFVRSDRIKRGKT